MFEELIHQQRRTTVTRFTQGLCGRDKGEVTSVYYKNGVKRIVEHAHSVYMQFMQRTVDVEVDASDNISVWKTDWTLNKDVAQGGETMSYLDFDRVQSELALRLAHETEREWQCLLRGRKRQRLLSPTSCSVEVFCLFAFA